MTNFLKFFINFFKCFKVLEKRKYPTADYDNYILIWGWDSWKHHPDNLKNKKGITNDKTN